MSGIVTISLEVELAWGFHDRSAPGDVPELSDDGAAERRALDRLLALCDSHDVPVTFDVVGHLLLDGCDGTHDGPHEEGWFARDPGTDAEADPLFYWPDLVATIRSADADHEVCTHTFSHVICDEVDRDVLQWELDAAGELHDRPVRSFVPPRHHLPPIDFLVENDVEVLRVPEGSPPSNPVSWFWWALTRSPTRSTLSTRAGEESDGTVVTTGVPSFMTLTANHISKGVAPPHPAYRTLPQSVRQRLHERFLKNGLEMAIETGGCFHPWSHLFNLAHEGQWPPIEAFFGDLADARDRGDVVVRTMDELPGEL